MSVTLRKARDRVRIMLRDTDARNPSYSGPEVDMQIADSYLLLQARLPASKAILASDFTISAGASTATLGTTVTQWTGGDGQREYAGEVQIRLRTDNQDLNRITWEQMTLLREHHTPTLPGGRPQCFALHESKTGAMTAYFEVVADQAYVCDLEATLMADDLRDFVGTGTDDADDVTLQVSRIGALAIELHAASRLVAKMTDEDLKERRLNPEVVGLWDKDSERALYKEAERRNQLQSSGYIMRMVS